MKLLLLFLVIIGSVYACTENKTLVQLTENNFVVIRGPINGENSAKVIDKLISKQNQSEVYIYLTTPGGSVMSGLEIIRTIESLVNRNVTVKCIGDVAISMGFAIFQYCPVRYVTASSILMQHQMSLETKGPINQINTYMEFIESVRDEITEHSANRLGIDVDEFESRIAHDWWLFGKKNIIHNTADNMVVVGCDFTTKQVNETVATIFGNIIVTYSNCPLSRSPLGVSFNNLLIPDDQKNKIMNDLDPAKYAFVY